jgi:hypothetical protein
VVTRDVDPGAIVAGVPARRIGDVADTDAKRLEAAARYRVFPVVTYNRHPLPAHLIRELREAATDGGYFLGLDRPKDTDT